MKLREAVAEHGKLAEKAYKRAFSKTFKWLRTQAIKRATSYLGVRRSALKGRWFEDKVSKTLWLGLNPLPVHRTGKPRQNKKGVRVSGSQYDGAFIMNDKLVAQRIGRKLRPIELVTKEISDDVKIALHGLMPLATEKFKKTFKQELNYAINHEKR